MAKRSPAVDVSKKNGDINLNEPVTLSTGITVLLKPVPTALIQEAAQAIKDPKVPQQKIEGKDYPVDNPNDPEYQRLLQEAFVERVQAGFDVMALMGVDLIDGLPEDDTWLKKLRYLEKRGRIDLSSYDLDDEFEREFVYKRHYALAGDDWNLITKLSGVTEEDIAKAKDNFRS